MLSNIIFLHFLLVPIIGNKNKGFTSAEIDFIFQTESTLDSLVIKSEVFNEKKGASIDLTSNKQILVFSSEKKVDMKNANEKMIITQDNQKIKTYQTKSNIILSGETKYVNKITLNNFPTYVHFTKNDNPTFTQYHRLGFAHDIIESDSIIHYLYKERKIWSRQFGLLFFQNDEGLLTFGFEGEFLNQQNLFKKKCKAVRSKYWGCKLTGIYFSKDIQYNNKSEVVLNDDNMAVKINEKTIIDNKIKEIVVPYEVFKYFVNNYFINQIKGKKCEISEDDYYKKIKCKDLAALNQLQKIHFVFDEYVDISIDGKKLFDFDNENSTFLIVYLKESSHFVLGKSFLEKFHTLFNYDDDSITFAEYIGVDKLEKKIDYKNQINVRQISEENYKRNIILKKKEGKKKISEEEEDFEEESDNKLIIMIFGVFLGGMLISLIIVLIDKIIEKRKKDKELEENSNYEEIEMN